jgi:hypothetical protein
MRTALPRPLTDHDTRASAPHKPLRPLVLVATLLVGAALAPVPAAAQGTQPCTEIENDSERLACYDRALRPNAPAASRGAAEAPSRETRASDRTPRESAAPRAAEAPAAARASAAASSREPVDVTIVKIGGFPGRNAIFTTDTGEIWVQTDGGRLQMPDPPFQAQIKPGAMGSRFLIPERGRAVRVRAHTE